MDPVISSNALIPLGAVVTSIIAVISILLWYGRSQKELRREIRENVQEKLDSVEERLTVTERALDGQRVKMVEIGERTVRIETKLDIILNNVPHIRS